MTMDLFDTLETGKERLAPGAVLLRGFAAGQDATLQEHISRIAGQAPFRQMVTPGGFRMSVAMTSCGDLGWITDRRGYRYSPMDPASGRPWPRIPEPWLELVAAAAAEAGFPGFVPDACLINRYVPGARMSLHQDRDERDYNHPIVSVSLGVPAVFQFGGERRKDRPLRVRLAHGDVVAWGGPARLRYHGILTVKSAHHPFAGSDRINLTFRKAG
ncbi:MAG: DNA oxidative demethylase AlkB [Ectothiorhodospiraceae bacterium]|nr:DNA oxidative demethylase AlkB [Ectothiorhodospiraceae bacterium]MCH8506272.1 DNA oxidative demethylase AlkB [Ectothiorhodospiraceae bacterium]